MCQLSFTKKDGSIFVQSPYFRDKDGIATVVRLQDDRTAPRTIEFLKEGKVTSHLVKYSHHPDGRVHFSQDGRVRTEIGRTAEFPLNGPIGKLFQIHAFYPERGFSAFDSSKMKTERPHLIFNYPARTPEAIRITGTWRRKNDVAGWSRPAGTPLGPRARLRRVGSAETTCAFLIGQPEEFPLQEHILVVSCDAVSLPVGLTESTLLILAGSDADEVENLGDVARPSEYLAAMYPVGDREILEPVVGTIDYRADMIDYASNSAQEPTAARRQGPTPASGRPRGSSVPVSGRRADPS